MRIALAAFLIVSSTGFALAQECAPPLKPMLRVELYFGRAVEGGRPVSDRAWERFVAEEMTRRLPGLTALDANGAWRGDRRMREHTKLFITVLPDEPAARERIEAIVSAYKRRFHQKSVGIVTQTVCAAF
jgi:hypothetical protein